MRVLLLRYIGLLRLLPILLLWLSVGLLHRLLVGLRLLVMLSLHRLLVGLLIGLLHLGLTIRLLSVGLLTIWVLSVARTGNNAVIDCGMSGAVLSSIDE